MMNWKQDMNIFGEKNSQTKHAASNIWWSGDSQDWHRWKNVSNGAVYMFVDY